jgi:hypothetical protein
LVNWEALGAVAELAGAVGVIASLFYLGSQLRRNSESIEAATALSISEATQQRLLAPAQNRELAEAFSKMVVGDELSAAERVQVAFFNRATMRGIESTFAQQKRGLLADDVLRGYEALLERQLSFPVFHDWWSIERGSFDPVFRELVDQLLQRKSAESLGAVGTAPGDPPAV